MKRGNRPGIAQIGHVTIVGTETRITGWALNLCAAQCDCHRHPLDGQLHIAEDQEGGRLGLASYPRPGHASDPPCQCCDPWTANELTLVVSDLADIAALQTQPPADASP